MTTSPSLRAQRERWLKTSVVALMCGVTAETVIGWAKAGKLHAWRTPGGQYRFDPAEVDVLMKEIDNQACVCCTRAKAQGFGEDSPATACERAV